MRKEKYIVVGRHASERGSWMPGRDIRGVQSAHRTEGAAWRAARVAERNLGNCDGADSLTDVLVRAPAGLLPSDELDDKLEDTYDFEGTLYVGCDYWKAHRIEYTGFGPVAIVK